MLKDDVYLEINGLQPSDAERERLTRRMSALLEEAPDGANMKLTVSRHGHALKAIAAIRSMAGPFVAAVTADRWEELESRLTDKLHKVLRRWKSRRFRTVEQGGSHGVSGVA